MISICTYGRDMDKELLSHHKVVYTLQLTVASKTPHRYQEN